LEPESSTSKQEFTGFDRVYTRRMTKKKIKQLQELKYDPDVEIDDTLVEKSPQVKQSKIGKGNKHVTYLSKPKTRLTNNLRLNLKVIFKPSLKKDNLIILDEDEIDEVPKKTEKGKKQLS
jgi:hypothetical protein